MNLRPFALLASLALAALVAGCAGTNFVRPDAESLRNGQTTMPQAMQRLGTPRSDGTVVKNGKTLKTLNYAYAATTGTPLYSGVVAARALTLYFDGDTLVGHEFVSSWAEDGTDFDEAKVASIQKGKTTRGEVVAVVGKPSGAYAPPLVKAPATDSAVYVYSQATRDGLSLRFYRKVLVVAFDDKGIVSDVEFASSGTK